MLTQKHSHAYMQTQEHTIIVILSRHIAYMYTAKQAWGKLHCKFMHPNTIIIWI